MIRGSEIQQLPVGEAFMHYSNVAPARVTLTPWWERPDSAQIKEDNAAAQQLKDKAAARRRTEESIV